MTRDDEQMEAEIPALHDFLETWGRHCGAPRSVFRGHLCDMLRKLPRAEVGRDGWIPIADVPLAVWGLGYHPAWRRPFPAQRNGDNGAVRVDTCEPGAQGWQSFATHWQPLPDPPSNSARGDS